MNENNYKLVLFDNKLPIIKSVKDNMYQIQSIIDAVGSSKQDKYYFTNEINHEIQKAYMNKVLSKTLFELPKLYEVRDNIPHEYKGIYIHHDLVRSVGYWASGKYALDLLM